MSTKQGTSFRPDSRQIQKVIPPLQQELPARCHRYPRSEEVPEAGNQKQKSELKNCKSVSGDFKYITL